jgi:hypothetical protein
MNVTRDVVRDLLPTWLAGEASADSAALVEEWLRGDAPMAAEAEALRRAQASLSPAAAAAPRPDLERTAIARVRRLLRLRTWLMAGGIFFSAMPFAFMVDDRQGMHFFMLRDAPLQAAVALCLGVACWIGLATVSRRRRG